MWPFNRRRGSGAGDAAPTEPAPPEPPTAPGPPAWTGAPPLAPRRALTLTTSPTFTSGLASQRAPLFTEPLAHQVSADAPSGLVSGLATATRPLPTVSEPPAPQRAPISVDDLPWRPLTLPSMEAAATGVPARPLLRASPPEPPRPVAAIDRPVPPLAPGGGAQRAPLTSVQAPPAAGPTAVAEAAARPSVATPPPVPPPRVLPHPPEAATDPSTGPTKPPSSGRSATDVPRAPEPGSTPSAGLPPVPLAAPPVTSPEGGRSEPVAAPDPSPDRRTISAQRSPPAPAPSTEVGDAVTVPPPVDPPVRRRRVGLGEPLSHRPAAADRPADEPQRSPLAPAERSASDPPPSAAPEPGRPTLPLIQPRRAVTAATSAGDPPPSQPIPAGVREAVQRATGLTVADAPVVRGPEVDRTASDIQARAYTDDATIHLPSSAGPIDAPEAKSLLAHELTHVAQQRELGSSRPPEHTGVGRQLEHEARTAEHAVQRAPLAGSPSSLPSLPVVSEVPVDDTAGPGAQRATATAPVAALTERPPLGSEPEPGVADGTSTGGPPPVVAAAVPPRRRIDGPAAVPTLTGTLGGPAIPTRSGARAQRAPFGLPDLGDHAGPAPAMPALPGMAGAGIPGLAGSAMPDLGGMTRGLPRLPALPGDGMPDLPGGMAHDVPDLPTLPSLPGGGLPDLPRGSGGGLPDLPSLPGDLPDLPGGSGMPDLGGMTRGLPTLPGGRLPDLSGMTGGLPALPGRVPDLGGMTRGLPELPGLPGIGGVPGLADQVSAPFASLPQAIAPEAGLAEQAGGSAEQAPGAPGGLAERAGIPSGLPDLGGLAEQASGASGASGGLAERAGDAVSGATDEDLEKKIAPLFDKFADRLRNELRHQRERAGRLTDL